MSAKVGLSIADVIDGRFSDSAVAGKSVLVGATASALQDLWPTPLGPARPGVWIQAMVYRTLAAERAGIRVRDAAELGRELRRLLSDRDARIAIAGAAAAVLERNRGALARSVAFLLAAMERSAGSGAPAGTI